MAQKTPGSPRRPRQAPPKLTVVGDGAARPAVMGDNSAFREEEERIQLISIVSKLSQADIAIEAAKVPLKAAQDARKKIVGLGKAAGFTAEELKKRLEEMANPARDNPEKFAREERHRKWLGIIQPEQTEIQLGDKVPTDAKDEAHWRAEGYKAGLRQLSSTPPTECPERFVQAFMKEHERGYLETTTANAPKAPKPTVAEQAAADYAADNPDLDAAARKLKNDPGFMARSEPESGSVEALVEGVEPMQDGDPDAAGASIPEGASTTSGPDDGFEMTEDELAAQAGRPSNDEVV